MPADKHGAVLPDHIDTWPPEQAHIAGAIDV